MIDIKLLRNQPELVKKRCDDKFVKVDVDAMIELDQRVRQFKQQIDDLNAQRNIAAANRDIEKGKEIKARISEIE
jgi:seryl-tRNA synthetase